MSIENRKMRESWIFLFCLIFGRKWRFGDVTVNFREWFGSFWYKIAQEKLVLQNGTPRYNSIKLGSPVMTVGSNRFEIAINLNRSKSGQSPVRYFKYLPVVIHESVKWFPVKELVKSICELWYPWLLGRGCSRYLKNLYSCPGQP